MTSADTPEEPADPAHPVPEPSEGDTVEDETVDDGLAEPDDDGDENEADHGPSDDPTLLEVLRGDIAEEDIPPYVKEQIDALAQSIRNVVPRINIPLSPEFTRSIEELRRKMASPAADAARRMLDKYNIDTRRLLEPIIKQIEPPTALVNARISAQIAASLPMDSFRRKLDPLIEQIAKSAIPKDFLRGIDIPPSALRNMYGPEFDRIAGKLFDFQKLFKNVDWEALKTGWYPPNWDPDRGIEQFATFIELAREEALPLAWVPNTDLTYLLLEADDDAARTERLIEHQATVLADCRTLLAEFEEQTFLVTQLGRALDACEAGFHESAQAHAASIIDTALRALFTPSGKNNWSYKWTVKPLLHTGEDWESVPLRTFRMLPTSVALLSVLKEFWIEKGDPVPTIPNRHAAAHAITTEQYTHANAIKFMMLATTMLAEVEHGGWAQLLKKTEAA